MKTPGIVFGARNLAAKYLCVSDEVNYLQTKEDGDNPSTRVG